MNASEDGPATAEGPAAAGGPEEILHQLHGEHVRLAAAARAVAQVTRAATLDRPALEQLDVEMRALRDVLPSHVLKEMTILFPEVEAACPWARETIAEIRRRHTRLDARFRDLQAHTLALLLGDETPRARRHARRAALSLQQELDGLAALEDGEVVAPMIRGLPPEATARVLRLFEAADGRGRMKQMARY